MMYKKRGQIVIFLIVGLMFIMLIAVSLMYMKVKSENELNHEAEEALKKSIVLYPPIKYVDYCVNYHVPNLLERMANQGGTLFPRDYEFVSYNNYTMRLWYTQQEGNALVSRGLMANELKDSLVGELEHCLDMRVYRQQGYEVNIGQLSVLNVSVLDNTVRVKINYPIELRKGTEIVVEENYISDVQVEYGETVELAQEILNSFTTSEYFDTTKFIVGYNATIFVERYQPYPYIVYLITRELSGKDVTFAFAIEDVDPFQQSYPQPLGCCEFDTECFLASKRETCIQTGGYFSEICSCNTVGYGSADDNYIRLANNDEVECNGEECSDCFAAKHGESWCDSVVGVGGRHFRQYCIDGEVFTDECKDYRQEICVESEFAGIKKAQCRYNNYESCMDCTTQGCCEDRNTRDCSWISDEIGCRPAVSPGMPFWREDSTAVCGQASLLCEDCEVSKEDILAGCTLAGDCGNKINAYGEANGGGIIGLNIFNAKDYMESAQRYSDVSLLSYSPSKVKLLPQKREKTAASISKLVAVALELLDKLSFIDVSDYLDYRKELPFKDTSFSYCNAWEPPIDNACTYCMESDISCSEYLCRSLGSKCMYTTVNGTGFCFHKKEGDSRKPSILSVDSRNGQGVVFAKIGQLSGYEINQTLNAQYPLDLLLTMSEPSRCKMTYLPGKSFDSVSGLELSSSEFSINQTLQLRILTDMDIFSRLLTLFNTTSYRQLADQLVLLKQKLEVLANKYPAVARFKGGYYPLIAPLVEQYAAGESREKIELLLDELGRGNYYLFVTCVDSAGNQNDDVFIRFSVADPCDDEQPPELISVNVSGDQLEVYGDEWLHCKYDLSNVSYELMNYTMECPDSIYSIDANVENSYFCKSVLDENLTKVDALYVICADHPEWTMDPKPLSLRLRIDKVDGASRFSTIDVDENSSYAVPSSPTYGSEVRLVFDSPYECSIGGSRLPCSVDTCLLSTMLEGEFDIDCVPHTQKKCDKEANFMLPRKVDIIQIMPLHIQSIFTYTSFLEVRIPEARNRSVQCSIDYGEGIIPLDIVEDDKLSFGFEDIVPGRYDAIVVCTDAYGFKAEEEFALII
jgi:hypothetical protein